MKPVSLSLRIAVWISALGVLLVCVIMSFAYIMLVRQLNTQAREHMNGKLDQVRHTLVELPDSNAISNGTHGLVDLLIGHDEMHIAVTRDGSTAALASLGVVSRDSLSLARGDLGAGPFFDWRSHDGKRFLSLIGTGKVQNGESVDIVITIDRHGDDALQKSFLGPVLLAIPIALAWIAASAWWIAYQSLSPLSALRKAIASVTTRDLSYRLPNTRLPSDLHEVADSFNGMLERLQEGVFRLLQFSGDLAHEMRTPISNILGKTQVALSKVRTNDQYRSVLESNEEELERISRLVEDMLFLAQTDNAEAALQREWVDLKQEATHIADFYESVAEEQQVTIEVSGEGKVEADRLMVQRAISNLVSNAIRHAHPGRAVTVHIAKVAEGTTVTVSNRGESIDPKKLPYLFERFYRADPGRSRTQGGTGLGLAIVKSIMTLHGGHTSVKSGPDGVTIFSLIFQNHSVSER